MPVQPILNQAGQILAEAGANIGRQMTSLADMINRKREFQQQLELQKDLAIGVVSGKRTLERERVKQGEKKLDIEEKYTDAQIENMERQRNIALLDLFVRNQQFNKDLGLRKGLAIGTIGGKKTVESRRTEAEIEDMKKRRGLSLLDMYYRNKWFEENLDFSKSRFKKEFGLQENIFDFSKTRFKKEFGLQKDIFGFDKKRFKKEFGLRKDMFDFNKKQFKKEFGLREDELDFRKDLAIGRVGRKKTVESKLAESLVDYRKQQLGLDEKRIKLSALQLASTLKTNQLSQVLMAAEKGLSPMIFDKNSPERQVLEAYYGSPQHIREQTLNEMQSQYMRLQISDAINVRTPTPTNLPKMEYYDYEKNKWKPGFHLFGSDTRRAKKAITGFKDNIQQYIDNRIGVINAKINLGGTHAITAAKELEMLESSITPVYDDLQKGFIFNPKLRESLGSRRSKKSLESLGEVLSYINNLKEVALISGTAGRQSLQPPTNMVK